MQFIETEIDESLIRKWYSEEPDHYKNVYVSDNHTLDEAVQDTVKKLNEPGDTNNKAIFYVIKKEYNIGFFALQLLNGELCLRTFYIRKHFREHKTEFISKLKKLFAPFYVPIYNNNVKAIGFLNRSGGIITNGINEVNGYTVLIFKFK